MKFKSLTTSVFPIAMLCLIQSPAHAEKTKSVTTTSSSTTVVPAADSVSDAQIAKIVKTANQGEVDAAKYARSKTSNAEVKDFANTMINAHEQNDQDERALLKKIRLNPADSTASENLEASAKTDMANLKRMKGADFDHAYIDGQVTMHQTVLNSLDNTLIPSAQNPDLKAMLQKTRGAVAEHLEHAKSLQENLNSNKM
jgi:putative membrane protein